MGNFWTDSAVPGNTSGRAFANSFPILWEPRPGNWEVEIEPRIRLAKIFGNRDCYPLRLTAAKSVFLSAKRRDRTLDGG